MIDLRLSFVDRDVLAHALWRTRDDFRDARDRERARADGGRQRLLRAIDGVIATVDRLIGDMRTMRPTGAPPFGAMTARLLDEANRK